MSQKLVTGKLVTRAELKKRIKALEEKYRITTEEFRNAGLPDEARNMSDYVMWQFYLLGLDSLNETN